ncbi:anhydro-N-acetylmuramic acid kinase [Coralliovum pocilloporae]|uniref:anhydro-N-acetylmuramic acid kinase n=1 Tax=Coralliovum pocilloporae TaxID=3066369 RepID=UPI003306F02B
MAKSFLAIGLMSGTSMDGIDVALIETDGLRHVKPLCGTTMAYTDSERQVLKQALVDGAHLSRADERPGSLAEAEMLSTDLHVRAIEMLLTQEHLDRSAVDVVGYHGQTVWHDPARALTVQLGLGQTMADQLAMTVVDDFRSNDMAHGGQGAPLAPVYHRALARASSVPFPVGFLNIGGVSNLTLVEENGRVSAFDTGPGNALIDDFIFRRLGKDYDEDGALAAQGRRFDNLVEDWLTDPYFTETGPKSLDRNAFATPGLDNLQTVDGVATLTAFTVGSIAQALERCNPEPLSVIVSGGGAHNHTMTRWLEGQSGISVRRASDFGFNDDLMEAEAFAYMAVRRLLMLPISFPGTTGAPFDLIGGMIRQPGGRS